MWFTSKQRRIEEQMAEYCRQVAGSVAGLCRTLKISAAGYSRPALQAAIDEVHSFEGRADDIRREIEVLMYSKALFPESRGDILGLLETLDKVPNQAEKVVWMLQTHHLVIPPDYAVGVDKLGEITRQCVDAVLKGVDGIFSNYINAAEVVGRVDRLESEADDLEAQLTDQVFSSDMNGTKKILMRDFISALAGVSDRAENTADRIRLIVAKRRI